MARECGNQGVAEERWALVAMVVGPVAERVMTSVLRRSRVSERKVVSGGVCGEKSGDPLEIISGTERTIRGGNSYP